ncbi:hypothetical protein [Streptacidiphilus sp. EB129]|uniref:hypothetical protein n=1 Tax=Streptacidiphilus sp. EB129 TaxID=3156262 RepID=UPI003518443C
MNLRASAVRLAGLASKWSYGDLSGRDGAAATATAMATEGLVHAVLALGAEVRDWRMDERIDRPPLLVYRAEFNGIGLGLYTGREAARDHCLDLARAEGATALAWVTEADEDTDELHDAAQASCTGYAVSPVEVAEAYDPDADES